MKIYKAIKLQVNDWNKPALIVPNPAKVSPYWEKTRVKQVYDLLLNAKEIIGVNADYRQSIDGDQILNYDGQTAYSSYIIDGIPVSSEEVQKTADIYYN